MCHSVVLFYICYLFFPLEPLAFCLLCWVWFADLCVILALCNKPTYFCPHSSPWSPPANILLFSPSLFHIWLFFKASTFFYLSWLQPGFCCMMLNGGSASSLPLSSIPHPTVSFVCCVSLTPCFVLILPPSWLPSCEVTDAYWPTRKHLLHLQ